MSDVQKQIHDLVHSNDVVLFMKGVPAAPQCGFSAAVVQVLGQLGIAYTPVNVLADGAIREGVKAYANWPTIPQLYVKGQFVGGCDIVREMAKSGELQSMLAAPSAASAPG
jgi:monothiol glutaredoxin